MSETIPSHSDAQALVGAYDEEGLPSSGTEASADLDAGTGDGDGLSGCPDTRPLRDRSLAEQLELTSHRLNVSRSIGFLPTAEATWLFATSENRLDRGDLALMEQLSDLLSDIEAEDTIATLARKPCVYIATTPECDVATAEVSAKEPAVPLSQGVAGRDGSPCAVAPPSPSLITTHPSASSQVDKANGQSRAYNRQALRWNRLPPNKRFLATIEAAARQKGLAVTLAFSEARERALMASTDPTRLLTHYLNRGLKAAGVAVPYSLRLEVSPEGRLHAHGVLIASAPAGADVGQLKAVLVSAAGKIHGRAGSKQCVFKDISDADGWHSYLLKSHRRTAKALGTEKTSVISRGMLRIARAEYEVSSSG
ncbi:MAG: hypothetical protein EOQ55_15125 [Mesorhizobium sp.]|uniref:hypothetical protein n=1 Tax=unclassified Mesorhizobium TaxID=325217 RepID=UPI000FCB0021|nr:MULTISPECIES: hypothetical protein [unclassified Mesorhizobium]RUV40265.1 hypothetical protein EOD29_28605 [Mesorhizobium sp. M1A.T.Ca.IN.004.03.1.1]RWG19411.1 MAG: hypothetical protein EOQ55_15125 [Mesorhizobium sp.]RWI86540.1 MAG: hypothetical protein EOR21_29180 [Mesorhizobium sp.]RWK37590.1 MAG: hypothetical protein EOR40_11800 [Mesorhizobium sp.]RWK91922.1 MAG: hypothetical protein EOR52_01990 [Mesorhizobium sp.]